MTYGIIIVLCMSCSALYVSIKPLSPGSTHMSKVNSFIAGTDIEFKRFACPLGAARYIKLAQMLGKSFQSRVCHSNERVNQGIMPRGKVSARGLPRNTNIWRVFFSIIQATLNTYNHSPCSYSSLFFK